MKILMCHSEDSGVGYYRIWQPAKALKQLGWQVKLLPQKAQAIPIDGKRGWEGLARDVDLIVMQRPDQPEIIALAMALREQYQVPIVFEIDDNIYDVSENSPSYQYWFPGSPLFEVVETFMKNADAITTTTGALAQVYSNLNEHTYVLPNYQQLDDWRGIAKPKPEQRLILGWAGSYTHYDDLYMIRRPLKKFLRNYPNAILRILGATPDFLTNHPQVDIRQDWVHVSKYYKKLAELNFELGLAPVVNRPFNQGKSNIKWQEYGMLQIPTVASPITYGDIHHGEDGYLAQSETDWYYYLCKLADQSDHRSRIGHNAQTRVRADYDISQHIQARAGVYEEIVRRGVINRPLTPVSNN